MHPTQCWLFRRSSLQPLPPCSSISARKASAKFSMNASDPHKISGHTMDGKLGRQRFSLRPDKPDLHLRVAFPLSAPPPQASPISQSPTMRTVSGHSCRGERRPYQSVLPCPIDSGKRRTYSTTRRRLLGRQRGPQHVLKNAVIFASTTSMRPSLLSAGTAIAVPLADADQIPVHYNAPELLRRIQIAPRSKDNIVGVSGSRRAWSRRVRRGNPASGKGGAAFVSQRRRCGFIAP